MKRFLNQLGVGPRQIVRIDALARLDRIPTTNTSRAPPTNGNAPGATKPCPTCLPISARLRPNTTSNTARRRRAEPPSPRTSTAWQSNVGCTRPTSGRTAKHGPLRTHLGCATCAGAPQHGCAIWPRGSASRALKGDRALGSAAANWARLSESLVPASSFKHLRTGPLAGTRKSCSRSGAQPVSSALTRSAWSPLQF